MTDLTDKQQLLDYLKSNGLWANHGLGQNFLIDREALDKIVAAAEIDSHDCVIEIGPGVGTLTEELVQMAEKVIAVELDEKLVKLLDERMSKSEFLMPNKSSNDQNPNNLKSQLKLINADILRINITELVGERKYKVVANIPYYITSKIIQLFLTTPNKPEEIVLLVQKEVAERICAKPGAMSVLALSVQVFGKPEIIGIVRKESFFPSPKVDSAILRIRTKSQDQRIKPDDEKAFFRVANIGFSAKRKTLANNLSSGYHMDKQAAEDIIKSQGLSENIRAQELSVEDWQNLAHALSECN